MGDLGEAIATATHSFAPMGWLATPIALITGWWAHKRKSRKQSDDMALGTVRELRHIVEGQANQIAALGDAMRDERRVCEANIARLDAESRQREERVIGDARHAKANLQTIMIAVKLAPEKAAAIVAEVEALTRQDMANG